MNDNLTYLASKIQDILSTGGYPDPASLAQLKIELDGLLKTLEATPPTISAVSSDFYTILVQLQEHIKRNETWKDFQVSSTGRVLLELIAAIGAFLQNSVQVSFIEAFPQTANRESSIYASTRMLGVKIARKTPSKTKVWLRRANSNGSLVIPEYTPFVVGGLEYFNAEPIVFPMGEGTLPINVTFDETGNAVRKDSLITQVYTGDVVFPNTGKIYFPCEGTVTVESDGETYVGSVKIISDASSPNSAFGSIVFADEVILPGSAKFNISLAQYDGSIVNGQFVPKSSSAFLRFPATVGFQIKRTGVGSSIITPALGTANIPQTAVVVTNESYSVAKNKYLLPQYLNKSIVIYDNDIFLHSGRIAIMEHTVVSTKEFYTIALNQPGFNVSNDHLYVEVFDGSSITIWTKADKPMWEYSADSTVFVDSTLGNGDTVLTFGNGIHGKRLEGGWTVGIRYVLTKGSLSNAGSSGLDVTCPSYSVIGGTLTPSYGGSDEKSADYYKFIAPAMFKSKQRAVTPEDHEAVFLSYPNVADVAVLGQKDIAPYDLRFMNRLTVALLPKSPNIKVYPQDSLMAGQVFDPAITNPKDPNEPNAYKFSDLELQDFQKMFSKSAFSGLDVDLFKSPIPKPVKIKIRAFIYKQYSLDTVSAKISDAVKSLFDRKPGILGKSLMIADLINACKLAEVDFIEVLQPSFNVILGDNVNDKCTFICLDSAPEIITEYTLRRSYNV